MHYLLLHLQLQTAYFHYQNCSSDWSVTTYMAEENSYCTLVNKHFCPSACIICAILSLAELVTQVAESCDMSAHGELKKKKKNDRCSPAQFGHFISHLHPKHSIYFSNSQKDSVVDTRSSGFQNVSIISKLFTINKRIRITEWCRIFVAFPKEHFNFI